MQRFNRVLLALAFLAAGINHFLLPDLYVRMMPEYLPAPKFLVQLSGVLEAALGALVLFESSRKLAGIGLALLLVAVFPANIQMALHPEQWPTLRPELITARLGLQPFFILWVLTATGVLVPERKAQPS